MFQIVKNLDLMIMPRSFGTKLGVLASALFHMVHARQVNLIGTMPKSIDPPLTDMWVPNVATPAVNLLAANC